MQLIGFVCIAIWIISSISQPSLGFVPIVDGESFGYNLGKLIFPVVGIIFLIIGSKKKSEAEGNKDNKQS